ncbi:hypothetical protein A2276_02805 [candidate division WOR-1 bacterium RIFOXYA12_FULL_43_27]|uniref:Uncharacterized protein n=1 Tax=candidate division WOR-1 bacterium RIFOXYC2_FULL_46_14 TaxID=1802587 RepID=A0A1F4U7S7_UNCSA|nr:MAG: hypothetical protein A2276_02805 [candidate division WOR-1 bacterium RIFOXYA12_FULL_43_27]OGC19362.1 MAG: hypothetical protein A2292_01530 [candidate division WOR-1 bacterium RIFOXYB2_FULL_46_45]OGC30351.1 MAG: hypothetical protein A2232_01530 [candidate division WOR-1 bacterium RIFOXYA2_FULL_46_56]OGC40952.1 MAG: hypothetical protein A2438_01530 [candidate division WOR-1 bacterium RIFOXYC2_FULL_46_14]
MAPNTRYSSQIFEVKSFLAILSIEDRKAFWRFATSSFEHEKDKRSAIIRLINPIEIEGRLIMSLRLKGVAPKETDGKVKAYSTGAGFINKDITCMGKNIIGLTYKSPNDYQADGTMTMTKLSNEVEGAIMLGPEITDLLLGFGFFEGLTYNDKPVGFAIYGMEREEDLRVGEMLDRAETPETTEKYRPYIIRAAELHRMEHDRRFFHGFLHPHNMAFGPKGSLRVVDLDGSYDFSTRPKEEYPTIIYTDLIRPIFDLYQYSTFNGIKVHRYPLLIEYLLTYFRNNPLAYYCETLKEHKKARYKEQGYQCHDFVNPSPIYMPGIDLSKMQSNVLLQPISSLFLGGDGTRVNLRANLNSNNMFYFFMEAIEFTVRKVERQH